MIIPILRFFRNQKTMEKIKLLSPEDAVLIVEMEYRSNQSRYGTAVFIQR